MSAIQAYVEEAPSHIKAVNRELVFTEGLERLDWPGNSPDLNPIELASPQLKRDSQKCKDWEKKSKLADIWREAWGKLDQEQQIRRWIDRLPWHFNEAHVTQHLPGSYNHARAAARARQTEGRQVHTASYAAQQALAYQLCHRTI